MTACKNWVAVASAEHVQIGLLGGFMQVCHGKLAPLKRIKPGDRVVYYSPTATFGGNDKLQAFTAIGVVQPGDPYMFDMGGRFYPYRRNVQWWQARQAPIRPLLNQLSFIADQNRWGYSFRFGLVQISLGDMHTIANAMGTKVDFSN